MSDTTIQCACSEDYGPCEDHAEVLAQREGARTRTADELAAVFISDAADLTRNGQEPGHDDSDAYATMLRYWQECPAGGWWDGENKSGYTYSEELHDASATAEGWLADIDAMVWQEDGYVIFRITGGPLA